MTIRYEGSLRYTLCFLSGLEVEVSEQDLDDFRDDIISNEIENYASLLDLYEDTKIKLAKVRKANRRLRRLCKSKKKKGS